MNTRKEPEEQIQDDRVFLLTRIVSISTVPFLIAAWVIFYLFPDDLHNIMPWDINPHMTAAFIGAGYLGGAYQLLFAVFEKRWHRVKNGFLPITSFSIFMLIATILHADRFDFMGFPAQIWVAIYILAPVFFLLVWFRNRSVDSGMPEPHDMLVHGILRTVLGVIAAGLMLFSVVSLAVPALTISFWPWKLTPLTTRVLAGWFSLLGSGGLLIAREKRWSAWRIPIQGIALWDVLTLCATFRYKVEFINTPTPLFLAAIWLSVLVLIGLLVYMDIFRRRLSMVK